MKLILEKLPNLITNVDKFGWTALHYAAKFNHQHIARLLLSAKGYAAYVAAANGDSKTALHIAVIHGHVVLAQEILSHCPDCWVQITGKSQNILHLAVKHEQREVLEFVLQNSWASELTNQQDNEGNTPLHLSVATRNLDGNCLVNHPFVDVNSFDNSNSTPLDRIVRDDQLSERQILIKDELEQAGGTRGYRNVATVKKKLRAASPDEVERVEKLAANYSIVATLIATVTFTTGFTIPGGYYSDGPHRGMAVLSKKAAFITFVISDSLAMIASIGAVIGLTVLFQTKNYRPKLAIVRINWKQIFAALMLMMIAFLTGLCAVLPNLAVMIVPYVLAAWLGGLICFTFLRKYEGRECTYTTRFKHSEADYSIFYPLGLYMKWFQDLTEAED